MSKAAEDLGVELSEESSDEDGDGGTHARKMHTDGIKREKKTIGCRVASNSNVFIIHDMFESFMHQINNALLFPSFFTVNIVQ